MLTVHYSTVLNSHIIVETVFFGECIESPSTETTFRYTVYNVMCNVTEQIAVLYSGGDNITSQIRVNRRSYGAETCADTLLSG